MTTRISQTFYTAIAVTTMMVAPGRAVAQPVPTYSISTYSVDGGAGVATGGPFTLAGIAGQHDAGQIMAGDTYSLTGGFFYSSAIDSQVRGWSFY